MRNRKFTFILCMALMAAVALFGVTEAKAGNFPIAGWNVDLTTPVVDNTYVYTFTPNPDVGDKISFVEILIPKLDLDVGGLSTDPNWPRTNISVIDQDNVVVAYEYLDYDGSTGFGIGDPRYDVLKLKSNNAKSFPLGIFILKISIDNQSPPATLVLGPAPTVMLLKAGNGQVWDSSTIGGLGLVSVAPPVGEPESFISVEGHEGFLINVQKDPFGNYLKVCLVDSVEKTVVTDAAGETSGLPCCTTAGEFQCNPTATADPIVLNIGDFGNTVVMCSGGTFDIETGEFTSPSGGCQYVTYSAEEATLKGGNTTSVWRFFYGRWIKVCLDAAC